MSENLSITWRGREVGNPVVRYLALGLAMLIAPFIIAIGVIFGTLLMVATFPLHVLLRLFGRRGFFQIANGVMDYAINKSAFARRG